MNDATEQSKRTFSQVVGLMSAVAVIPRTFQQPLMPRSLYDQGIITGLTVAMVYLMGVIFQDGVNAVADTLEDPNADDSAHNASEPRLWLSIAAIAAGWGIERWLAYEKDEPIKKSIGRTSGYWLRNIGIAGAIAGTIYQADKRLFQDKPDSGQNNILPWVISAGVLYTLAGEYLRTRDESVSIKENLLKAQPARAVAIGAGVTAALTGIVYSERKIAQQVDGFLDNNAPRLQKNGYRLAILLPPADLHSL